MYVLIIDGAQAAYKMTYILKCPFLQPFPALLGVNGCFYSTFTFSG